jgi:hypothetical protein
VAEALDSVQQTVEKIDANISILDEKRKNIAELDAIIQANKAREHTIVKLKLRDGKAFEAYRDNLMHTPGSVFCHMFSSDVWQPSEDGAYHFDRPSEYFERIIEYAESGKLSYKGLNERQKKALEENVNYFFPKPAETVPPIPAAEST